MSVSQVLPPPKTAIYDSTDFGCPAPVGGTFTCDLGTIRVGETVTVQLNLLVRGNKWTVTQTATVTSSTPDPWMLNNSDTRVVTSK